LAASRFPHTGLPKVFLEHPDDPLLIRFVSDMAIPLASAVNILDPGLVILGGGVVKMEGFPVDYLESEIRRRTRKPYPEQGMKIVLSENSVWTGVTGAGLLGHRYL